MVSRKNASAIIAIIGWIVVIVLVALSQKNNPPVLQNDSTILPEHAAPTDQNKLVQYALKKINEDRAKFDLLPVSLSNNHAAQLHAENMLNTKILSHWTTDGMKPYMKYRVYGGTGHVGQNIAYGGFGNLDIDILNKCKSGEYNCARTDPMESIDILEHEMMYNDSSSDWGHKENILDKHHTHVSLGIAYDDYFFAFVQNFEDNYIHPNKQLLVTPEENDEGDDDNSENNIEISGSLLYVQEESKGNGEDSDEGDEDNGGNDDSTQTDATRVSRDEGSNDDEDDSNVNDVREVETKNLADLSPEPNLDRPTRQLAPKEEDHHFDLPDLPHPHPHVPEGNNNHNEVYDVSIYYDEVPTPLQYKLHKDDEFYDMGKLIAIIVEPPPSDYYYEQPADYTLIEADEWSLSEDQTIDIRADISDLVKTEGVYTIVIDLKDNINNDVFPVTSYSIFKKE